MLKLYKVIFFIFLLFIFNNKSFSDIVQQIEIKGNQRIPVETITSFSTIKIGENIDDIKLNSILKNLYGLNFFKDIKISFENGLLKIFVIENPVIVDINYDGIKKKSLREKIFSNLSLSQRSSFSDYILKKDLNIIKSNLKNLGYYSPNVETFIEDLEDNKINLNFKVSLGDKAKIKKISFIGNKIFKDRTLRNLIVTEEDRFWKFISNKKFLNESLIDLDTRLLKNYYLNKGYYDVEINSTFAKYIDSNEGFELIYNINANKKIYFGDLTLEIPSDYDESLFDNLLKIFDELKDTPYSINSVNEIIEEIDLISINEEYEAVQATIIEDFIKNRINLKFIIEQQSKFTIDRINVFGNTITKENVIRNQLAIDEGDFFNDILNNKSTNNLKSLNIFKNVENKVINTSDFTRTINITVEEKATGEIFAGAGFGTTGGSFIFGVKENNYLGKGINLDTNLSLSANSIKGKFGFINPNYMNSDKSLYFDLESIETDNLSNFGYKTNKTGISIGSKFEILDDTLFSIGSSSYLEKIDTDFNASKLQKKQSGDYFDSFLDLNLDYDKRNQKFKTTDGFISSYNTSVPILSKKNYTFTNSYNYKLYNEFFENNITSASFFIKSANSLSGENIKISERLHIPSSKLRGFEVGKIGPKDGEDFIGGNFISTINLSTTMPYLLPSVEAIDFSFFSDFANIWGVDYDKTLDNNKKIRSSVGIAVDWFTPIGPLNFSYSLPLSKNSSDITEKFRFNLGTTF